MFRTLRNLFRRKPSATTKRVISTRVKPLTEAEHEALYYLDKSRAPVPPHVPIQLDDDTRERLLRKAQQGKPTPIWPMECSHVVGITGHVTFARLRDIFSPNPVPPGLIFINLRERAAGCRGITVMVVEHNVDVILQLHIGGAHLIDPWGKPLDMTEEEEPAVRRGRDMSEGASKREEAVVPVVLDAAFLPDFASHREAEPDPATPEPFVGGGGDFGGGGASGSWDSSSDRDTSSVASTDSPSGGSYDSSPSSSDSSSSYDSGSSSSDSSSSGGSDGW